MLKRWLSAVLLLAGLGTSAVAQTSVVASAPPFSGAAVTATGYNLQTGGSLFMATSTALQSMALPYSYVIGFKGNSSFNFPNNQLILQSALSAVASGFNFFQYYNANGLQEYTFTISHTNNGTDLHCYASGTLCIRTNYLQDNNWHSLCVVQSTTTSAMYLDNTRVDYNGAGTSYAASTSFWTLGNGVAANLNVQIRELGIWKRALSPAECVLAANLNIAGKTFINNSTDAPSLQTGMVDGWTFGNCNASGCAAVVGSDNWIYDPAPTTCSVTGPSNGATGLIGNVSLTVSTTDPVGISSVTWYVDNFPITTATASPFTSTWATTGANKVADGSHSIYALCKNAAGNTLQSSTITASTNNGVANKTLYLSGAAGASDSNDCLHQTFTTGTSGPCLTTAGINTKINASPLLGGDSVLAVSGSTITTASGTLVNVLTLVGPNSPALFGTQNVYPGKTITIGTTSACIPLTGVTTNCATVNLGTNSWTADGGVRRIGMITGMNVANITVQGWMLSGNGMSAAICDTCGWGVAFGAANGQQIVGITVQNNQITSFTEGVWVSQTYSYGFPSSGTPCGNIIQNNIVNGSAITSVGEGGVTLDGGLCASGAVSGSLISNYAYNIGDNPSATVFHAPVYAAGNAYNIVDKFNVSGPNGANQNSCGAPYSNWWFEVSTAAIYGNEAFRMLPTSSTAAPCDTGGFDADIGTYLLTIQYNYAHNNWGPAMTILNGRFTNSTIDSGARVIRYNMFENSWLGNIAGNGFTGQVFPDFVYNNSLYNGRNQQTDPYFSQVRSVFAYGTSVCPLTGSYIANNIFASGGTQANFISLQDNGGVHSNCNPQITWRNNDYWAINSGVFWWVGVAVSNTLVNWETAVGETGGITSNPTFAGVVGNDTVCYSGTGIPAQPGLTPCPSSYKLTTGSAALDVGISDSFLPAQYGSAATVDYYNATVPQTGHGSNYNDGADGAFH